MSTNTSHYNLTKPAGSENYDVSVQNGNMDKIDAALWALPATFKKSFTANDNIDSISDGIYYIAESTPLNAPTGLTWCILFQITTSTYMKHQYIFKPATGAVYMREYSGTPSTWIAWKQIAGAVSDTIATGITYKIDGRVVTIFINNVSVSVSSGWSSLATLPSAIGSPYSVHVKSIDGTDLRVSGTSLDYRGSASAIYGTITYVI